MNENQGTLTQQLNARIPKNLHQDLTIYCLKKGVSKEVVVRQIIEEFLNKENKKKS